MADLVLDRDLQKLLKNLRRLPKAYQKERKRMLRKASRPMVKAIQSRTPVKNGVLKRSIKVFSIRKSPDLFVGVKVKSRKSKNNPNGSDAFYAHFIEYGFRHIAWPNKGKKIYKYSPNRISSIQGKQMVHKGYIASKSAVTQRLIAGAKKIFIKYKRRYEV